MYVCNIISIINRTGLDEFTRSVLGKYDHIIYISCNPYALHKDIEHLKLTHSIIKFAVFDHFAYTPHLECGVYLQRK